MSRRGNGEGSIFKRSDGRWAATLDLGYLDGKRHRKTYYGKTRRAVQEQLTEALRTRQQGLPILTERETLSDFLERWLRDSARPQLRPLTYVTYEGIVRHHLIPILGRHQIRDVTPQHVQKFLNERSESGLAPATVRNILRVLHRALEIAMRWGLVARNVADLVDGPRMVRNEVHPLTGEEARCFLDTVSGDRLEALYTVALATGLRQGEALGLRWSSVDLGAGTLAVTTALQLIGGAPRLVEPKSATSRRVVVLPGIAIEALRRHRAAQLEERLRAGDVWGTEWDLVFGQPNRRATKRTRAQGSVQEAPQARRAG